MTAGVGRRLVFGDGAAVVVVAVAVAAAVAVAVVVVVVGAVAVVAVAVAVVVVVVGLWTFFALHQYRNVSLSGSWSRLPLSSWTLCP